MARYNWNVVGSILGVVCRTKNHFDFCRNWISKFSGMTKLVALIGTAGLLCYLWKTTNVACFQRIQPKDLANVILCLSWLLNEWITLHKEKVQRAVHVVFDHLRRVAREVFGCRHG
jgi:hypothetical protein